MKTSEIRKRCYATITITEKFATKPAKTPTRSRRGRWAQIRHDISPPAAIHDTLNAILSEDEARLRPGESALNIVERTVMALEDSPLFNSGCGAALTSEGTANTMPRSWMTAIAVPVQ